MPTGRNELCPCGSGKKYKHCCEGKRRVSKGMIALLLGIVALAALGVYATISGRRESTTTSRVSSGAPAANPMNPGAPQPPGPVPPGKVWSKDHGHWHDINVTPAGTQTAAPQTINLGAPPTAKAPVPQPPGPAPAGKVWSPEHGHWHDAPK